MIVFRISNELYKEDISGNGAAINGSRWNSKGTRMLYTSESISLAILESLVHLQVVDIPDKQYLLQIELPDNDFSEVRQSKIKDHWQHDVEYTQWIGAEFLKNNQSLILKVPSAVVPQEHNFLINPLHTEFRKVKVEKTELLELDKRLFIH